MLMLELTWHYVADQPVETVIVIAAKKTFISGSHGASTSEILQVFSIE
jgi:hypothetical protein